MTYLEFREQWHGAGCFNVYQLRAWNSGFDRCNIDSPEALKRALYEKLDTTDLALKQKDFEHLLFNPSRSAQILHFRQFVEKML